MIMPYAESSHWSVLAYSDCERSSLLQPTVFHITVYLRTFKLELPGIKTGAFFRPSTFSTLELSPFLKRVSLESRFISSLNIPHLFKLCLEIRRDVFPSEPRNLPWAREGAAEMKLRDAFWQKACMVCPSAMTHFCFCPCSEQPGH